ncbi:hydrogenase expression/formation protein [Roseospira navarrensis]|uniref:Hydrogenase expression/formation protein n=1 Tax=Roseospira navarrensis TaxID=140058 RepID=A0A7X1ZFB7_9PROT|nr:hydrogenase expression/formation protein [Roseospira navarrensis]MQX37451.1 hydrogenase expression/formation protein [Roseospira navarrensis]
MSIAPPEGPPGDWAAGPALPAPGTPDPAAPGALSASVARARALAEAEALVSRAPEALALVEALLDDLRMRAVPAPDAPPDPLPSVFDLTDIGPDGLTLLDQILGTGEVSGEVREPDGGTVAVQESVLTGVWRLHRRGPDGQSRRRWIEAGPMPRVVAAARGGRAASDLALDETPPTGTMAAWPLLSEIVGRAAAHKPGRPNHVVTLSLLPVNAADLACLKATLGPGPVTLRAGGYGTCDMDLSGVDGVWSVRFLNASGTVILDTLEVGGVPAVVAAAPEDFADAATRLAEIRDAYL